jgi:hypothetical protein
VLERAANEEVEAEEQKMFRQGELKTRSFAAIISKFSQNFVNTTKVLIITKNA